ncbi:antibiotic biosynthesis monooxygenase [Paenibacillus oenotherae]|uniref:Antibiotic biosynthesis monooxygenase n=1 Tax=Paenibacillus oenotherae TaxID=1435645 RepID=A0ABS7D905_9BACL|nr:putative quinol monooxygenase [Paenibacillus oenotherae]MBW7476437.1 antibiotic biosynthesis monooxygenase [Paenibacillus oenotherae]
MNKFAVSVKFTAQDGKCDELAQILLEAAEMTKEVEGCDLYIVHLAENEADTIWVNEIWRNEEAHAASLELESTIMMIQRAKPLIAGVEQIRLIPVGGKGFIK